MRVTIFFAILCGTGFQVFIDTDRNMETGYGAGYEYVVRVVDDELSLLDWQQIQLHLPEAFGGRHVRATRPAIPLVCHTGGWGILVGFASVIRVNDNVTVQIPDGRWKVEFYDEGKVCNE
ncbi:hypothetical protein LCGC14_1129930 [marine sediment metagenome]|uniref:Uncharacterized protein n=1 Tax=marine sediment metagenome TaxID=412755 RepID=A0A0F9M687_9ZZZZ